MRKREEVKIREAQLLRIQKEIDYLKSFRVNTERELLRLRIILGDAEKLNEVLIKLYMMDEDTPVEKLKLGARLKNMLESVLWELV